MPILSRYSSLLAALDLLFDWFGISYMTTDIFCLYLQNRLIQTSQTGEQWYSDTSHFSIPWGSITVSLTSCLTGLESAVCQLTIFVFICKTDFSKPVKQEANGTVILSPLAFPGGSITVSLISSLTGLESVF